MLVAEDGASETHGSWPPGKEAHDIGPTPYLLAKALQRIDGPDLMQVRSRKGSAGEDLRLRLGEQLRRPSAIRGDISIGIAYPAVDDGALAGITLPCCTRPAD